MKPFVTKVLNFFAPVTETETPAWFYRAGRLILSLTFLLLPLLYDGSVPEVAGDPRWYLMHFSVLLLTVLFFFKLLLEGEQVAKAAALPWPQRLKLPLTAWAVLGLAVWSTFTLFWTYSPPLSLWFWKHFIAYCGLFGFVFLLRDMRWYRNVLWILVFTLIPNALLGSLQFFGMTDAKVAQIFPFWGSLLSLVGSFFGFLHAHDVTPMPLTTGIIDYFAQAAPPAATFANKNIAASFFVLVMPMAFYMFLTTRSAGKRLIAWAAYTLGSIFFLYTRSRGSWMAALFATVLFAGWLAFDASARKALKEAIVRPVIIALLILSAGFVNMLGFQISPLQNFNGVSRPVSDVAKSVELLGQDASVGARLSYDLNGLVMLKDHLLTGVGIGAFDTAYPLYHDAWRPTPSVGYGLSLRPQRTHNDLMQAFVEMGLIGGGLFVLLFAGCVMMARRLKHHHDVTYAVLPTQTYTDDARAHILFPPFLLLSITALCLNSLWDFPFQMPTAPAVLWSLAGLLTGVFVLSLPAESRVALLAKTLRDKAEKAPALSPALLTGLAGFCLALSTVALVYNTYDNHQRWKGDQYLKGAMALSMGNVFNEQTKGAIDKALALYPMNNRTREYYAVIYANYKGATPVDLGTRLAAVTEGVKYDPYMGNGLVNLAGLHIQNIERMIAQKNIPAAQASFDAAAKAHNLLRKVAPFSPYPYLIGGTLLTFQSKYAEAVSLYDQALKLDPNMVQAQQRRAFILALMASQTSMKK